MSWDRETFDWNDAAIFQLRELWAEGLSAKAIGATMGVSKNAVVGKAHRLKLTPRPSPLHRSDEPRPPRRASNVTLPSFAAYDTIFGHPPHAVEKLLTRKPGSVRELSWCPGSAVPVTTGVATSPLHSTPVSVSARVSVDRPLRLAPQSDAPVVAVGVMPRTDNDSKAGLPKRPLKTTPCCWPMGEPGRRGFRCCDAPAPAGKSYCPDHAAVAYVRRSAAVDQAGV